MRRSMNGANTPATAAGPAPAPNAMVEIQTEVLSDSTMSTLSRVISWLVRLAASDGLLWSS